jgi:hypothetical protein
MSTTLGLAPLSEAAAVSRGVETAATVKPAIMQPKAAHLRFRLLNYQSYLKVKST